MVTLIENPAWAVWSYRLEPVAAGSWRGKCRGVAASAIVVIPWRWAEHDMNPEPIGIPVVTQVEGAPVEGASVWSDGGTILSTDLSRQTWPEELV